MPNNDLDLPPGALELLMLKVLSGGKLHGYSIVRAIRARGKEALRIEEGTLYPALHRMERRGWIESEWGPSESNRRAKYYAITSAGRKELRARESAWTRMSGAMSRVLRSAKAREA